MVNWLLGHSLYLDTWQSPCLEVLPASLSILSFNSCKRMWIVYLSCTFDCPIQIMIPQTSVECGFLGGQNLHIVSCFLKKKHGFCELLVWQIAWGFLEPLCLLFWLFTLQFNINHASSWINKHFGYQFFKLRILAVPSSCYPA